jgi:hypothetical protein
VTSIPGRVAIGPRPRPAARMDRGPGQHAGVAGPRSAARPPRGTPARRNRNDERHPWSCPRS